jgi:O-antigen/teichoic acid export membrane protein
MNMKRIVSQFLGSQLLFSTFINLLLALVALASGSMAARILGVEERGELAAIQLWPTFLAGFSMLGLSEAIVYYTAKKPVFAGRYLFSAVSLTLLVSIPFMGLGYVLIPVFLSSQSSQVVAASRTYLFIIPLFSLVALPLHSLRGRNDLWVWNWVRLAPSLGWICVLLAIGLSGRDSADAAALGYLWMMGLLFLPIAWIVRRRVPGPYRVERHLWRPMLSFGLPSFVAALPVMLNLRLDQLLMVAFLSPDILGLYVVAVAWASAVSPLLGAIGIVIFPRVAAQSTPAEGTKFLIRGFHLATLIGIGVLVVLLPITPSALPLIFGQPFAEAVPASLILILAGVVASINGVLGEGMRGFGKPSVALVSECAGLVVTVLALVFMLKPWGMIGASISSLLGYSGTMVVFLLQIRKITGIGFGVLLLPDRSDFLWIWTWLRGLISSSMSGQNTETVRMETQYRSSQR